ncbi:hypothetical protein PkoCFBP13504_21905 [Pseudomonas koreensis]|nr:hypothetical protein PkoCFBP13504_21905 [Pseudomonas koreensis]
MVLRFLVIGIGKVLRLTAFPCRSEPARDSGLSVDIIGKCQCAIASRLTPTGDQRCVRDQR